ncbi:MAG: cupin domain-containing protein [Dehalococcoidia bacterium]|nr:cupin domain-containing protein [Dehalococcoidia bacterium]
MEVKRPEYVFKDERGELSQVISGGPWRQLNILKRRAGSLGGGHYHARTEELFYVLSGKVRVKIFDTLSDCHVKSETFAEGDCFTIMPYEQHYMSFLTHTVMVVLYSQPFNEKEPDVMVDQRLPKLGEAFHATLQGTEEGGELC